MAPKKPQAKEPAKEKEKKPPEDHVLDQRKMTDSQRDAAMRAARERQLQFATQKAAEAAQKEEEKKQREKEEKMARMEEIIGDLNNPLQSRTPPPITAADLPHRNSPPPLATSPMDPPQSGSPKYQPLNNSSQSPHTRPTAPAPLQPKNNFVDDPKPKARTLGDAGGEIQIQVESSSTLLPLQISSFINTTISDLHTMIFRETKIPIRRQKIVVKGKALAAPDSPEARQTSLRDANIQLGDKLFVLKEDTKQNEPHRLFFTVKALSIADVKPTAFRQSKAKSPDGLVATGKVILPRSVSDAIKKNEALPVQFSFLKQFAIRVVDADGNELNDTVTHCSVMDFSGEEGCVVMPPWLMDRIGCSSGNRVEFSSVTLPQGLYVRFLPEDEKFLEQIPDHRAFLEQALTKQYTTLTKGDKICTLFHNREMYLTVLEVTSETGPCDAINIADVDLAVDFANPSSPKKTASSIPADVFTQPPDFNSPGEPAPNPSTVDHRCSDTAKGRTNDTPKFNREGIPVPTQAPEGAPAAEVADLRIMSITGSPTNWRLFRSDKIQTLFNIVMLQEDYDGSDFDLTAGFPPKTLAKAEANQTIGDFSMLCPRSVVTARPK